MTREQAEKITWLLVQGLEMAVGLRPPGQLLTELATREAGEPFCLGEEEAEGILFSFSGGVADCIAQQPDGVPFGDIGVLLGKSIAACPLLKRFKCISGTETIRATVVGAGTYTTSISGSTAERFTTLPSMARLPRSTAIPPVVL